MTALGRLALSPAALLRVVRKRLLSDERGPYHPLVRRLLKLAHATSEGGLEVVLETAHYHHHFDSSPDAAAARFEEAEQIALHALEDIWATRAELEADRGAFAAARRYLANGAALLPDSPRLAEAAAYVRSSERTR